MTDHRCLAGKSCRGTCDGAGRGAFTEEPKTLCPACFEHARSAARQLTHDWLQLRSALGENSISTGQRVKSTPAPAIPISLRKESLMAQILDTAQRAAAIISDRLGCDEPTMRRKPPQRAHWGSIAWCAAQHTRPHTLNALRASEALIVPNLDILAAAPAETALIWTKPARCDQHAELINRLQAELDITPAENSQPVGAAIRQAHTAAGICDACNNWGPHGQQRELSELSGIQILQTLTQLHQQTRAELGETRLRHRYRMPCPNCGAPVGRDDGTAIVDCRECESSWTEREYQFLVGLITRERLDMDILKYLLAEAYARLDRLQGLVDIVTDEEIQVRGAGAIIKSYVCDILEGHKRPADRAVASNREATQQRQDHEDNDWAWRNETPYRPPKRKPRKATRPAGPPITPSSLTTLLDPDLISHSGQRCPDCNMTHAGECA